MKKAIVLGGTSPHVELIKRLKQREYETILVDYLDNSPGMVVADHYICSSTLDKEAVLEIARENQVNLVISTCIDQANSTCCYVAEKMGLSHPYSYKTSLDVTDKGLMKSIMINAGIPTSKFTLTDSIENIVWEEIQFPAVVKPVDCNSSKGVHRVDSKEETIRYVQEALKLSRNHKAIIEGFNEGVEIQVDCFAENGTAKVVMTRQKKKINAENEMVLQSTGSIIPAMLSQEQLIQIKEIASNIANAFKLENTPFFYQAIVNDQGVSVLEFAPRIGGGLSYYLIKRITGFDVLDAAINSFLGQKSMVNIEDNPKFYATTLLYMSAGIFDHIEGFEELKKEGTIAEAFQLKKKGTVISEDMRSSNRVGAIVIEADNFESLQKKEEIAYQGIRIYDENGNDVLKRGLS